MAQPIALEMPPRDPKRELLARLEQAPAEHAAALLDGYELLQSMHEHGIFITIRGLLGAGDKLTEAVSEKANTEQAIRAMRNAILLTEMLGSIDPELLQGTCVAVSQTLGDVRKVSHEPPSLLSLLGSFLSRDLRRGLGLVSTLLGNLAYQLKIRTEGNSKR